MEKVREVVGQQSTLVDPAYAIAVVRQLSNHKKTWHC
jgi:hypothetical protein